MKSLDAKSIMLWAGVCVVIALAFFATGVLPASRGDALARDDKWPPLPQAQASCPARSEHAADAARAALAAAAARMQRYAFAPRDGRLALDRLAEAAECARAANDGALEAAASQQLADMRARIEGDARDHFMRYQHLKSRDRVNEASTDIAFLVELGWPESGELADRLRRDASEAQP
jgi:hypothetical protein